MTMIKCPECRHHISSMAKACPECGAPIDPDWAKAEAEKELKKLEEVPFTVEVGGEEVSPTTPSQEEDINHIEEEFDTSINSSAQKDNGIANTPSLKDNKADSASKGKRRGRYLFLIILLGIFIGGFFYYDYTEAQKREQHAYELLQGCSNPDFYDDFIIRFPKSKYIEEVRERRNEVAKQQDDWLKLIERGNRTELLDFVRLYPTSPYVKVAQTRIDSLDWAEAQSLRTLEAVTHYMAAHPDGYYIDNAETLRQALERARTQAEAVAAMSDSLARADSVSSVGQ